MVRIAVVGSLMMDLVARVPRHPQAGETIFGTSFATAIGGKGLNQAVAARRLGAEVALIGCVGDDSFGNEILAFLGSESVEAGHVVRDVITGTGVAIPLVYDDGGNSIIAIPRANLALTATHIRAARETIAAADILLVQFETSRESVVEAVRIAAEAGVRVVLNVAPPAPFLDDLQGSASVIVANETEAAVFAPGTGSEPAQALELSRIAHDFAIVTLGPRGSLLAQSGRVAACAPFPVTALDSVGAGDAFCGALAVMLAEGAPPEVAVRFASAAGALATTRPGASPSLPLRSEVEALLASAG